MANQKNVYIEKNGKKTIVGKAILLKNGELEIILEAIPLNGILRIEENKIQSKMSREEFLKFIREVEMTRKPDKYSDIDTELDLTGKEDLREWILELKEIELSDLTEDLPEFTPTFFVGNISDDKGSYLVLVNTEGFSYPRYVTKLVNYL